MHILLFDHPFSLCFEVSICFLFSDYQSGSITYDLGIFLNAVTNQLWQCVKSPLFSAIKRQMVPKMRPDKYLSFK